MREVGLKMFLDDLCFCTNNLDFHVHECRYTGCVSWVSRHVHVANLQSSAEFITLLRYEWCHHKRNHIQGFSALRPKLGINQGRIGVRQDNDIKDNG